jgi:hypothetical protein
MSEERRPLWPSIAALLIGLPVLYVASFGPACRAHKQHIISGRATWIIYRPMFWMSFNGPPRVAELIRSYAKFCEFNPGASINSNEGVVSCASIGPIQIDDDPFSLEGHQ